MIEPSNRLNNSAATDGNDVDHVVTTTGLDLKTQILRFVMSGVLAAVVDFGLMWILLNLVDFTSFWAKTFGWIAGTITAYMINRRWTFQAEASVRRLVAVAALYIITFITQVGIFEVLLPVLYDLDWPASVAQFGAFVVAQSVATVINFIVQRAIIFRVK